jgi:NADPH2:quinone reductase
MQAIEIQTHGGPEVLTLVEAPDPQPGPGEVRVDLAAAGVNFIETYQRSGYYPVALPFVLGAEGAGTVAAVGPGVDTVRVGDRVASVDLNGAYATSVIAAADRVVAVPDAISDETAAAGLLQGLTAHYLLFDSYRVRAGDVVLVHAAAGGMGLLVTQLATKLGATVIGVVSTVEKEKLVHQAGAAEVIRYGEADIATEVRRITGGTGVAAAYDGVGKDTFESSLASLRRRGTLVLYGAASGAVPPLDPQRLQAAGSVFLTRPTLRHHIADRAELETRTGDVFGWIADGSLKISIYDRYPLAEARRAHEDIESRRTTGKLLLIP